MGGGKKKRQGRTSNHLKMGDLAVAAAEITAGSDRVAAILGGTLVDATLIAAIMVELDDPNDAAKLFDDLRGPFSTFYSRILAGKMLGLFDAATADQLHTIRQIRNNFAHSLANLNFTNAEVAEKCAKLPLSYHNSHQKRGISEQRGSYEDACYGLFNKLLNHWRVKLLEREKALLKAREEGREADVRRLRDHLRIVMDAVSASHQ